MEFRVGAWGKFDTCGAIIGVHLFYSFQETQFLQISLLKKKRKLLYIYFFENIDFEICQLGGAKKDHPKQIARKIYKKKFYIPENPYVYFKYVP